MDDVLFLVGMCLLLWGNVRGGGCENEYDSVHISVVDMFVYFLVVGSGSRISCNLLNAREVFGKLDGRCTLQ